MTAATACAPASSELAQHLEQLRGMRSYWAERIGQNTNYAPDDVDAMLSIFDRRCLLVAQALISSGVRP